MGVLVTMRLSPLSRPQNVVWYIISLEKAAHTEFPMQRRCHIKSLAKCSPLPVRQHSMPAVIFLCKEVVKNI